MKKQDNFEEMDANITKIDSILNNNICLMFNPENKIKMIQIGTDKSEDQVDNWFKCKMTSGKTFLFTKEGFTSGAIKSIQKEPDEKKISEVVIKTINSKKRRLSKGSDNDVYGADVKRIHVQFINYGDDLQEKISDLFEQQYQRLSSFSETTSSIAVEEENLMRDFQTPYTQELKRVDSNEDYEVKFVIVKFEDDFFAFYLDDSNSTTQIWQQGILPVSFFGKECSKTPEKISDLDDKNTRLDDLEILDEPDDDIEQKDPNFIKELKAKTKSEEDKEVQED